MTTDYPARPGYKPTTDQMLAAWIASRPLTNGIERIELEVGFYEWLSDVLKADLHNLRNEFVAEYDRLNRDDDARIGVSRCLYMLDRLRDSL